MLFAATSIAAGEPVEPPAAKTPEVASATVTAPRPDNEAEAKDGKTIVCKRETLIGTRLARRVCLTRDDFEARRVNSKEAVDEAMRQTAPAVPFGLGKAP